MWAMPACLWATAAGDTHAGCYRSCACTAALALTLGCGRLRLQWCDATSSRVSDVDVEGPSVGREALLPWWVSCVRHSHERLSLFELPVACECQASSATGGRLTGSRPGQTLLCVLWNAWQLRATETHAPPPPASRQTQAGIGHRSPDSWDRQVHKTVIRGQHHRSANEPGMTCGRTNREGAGWSMPGKNGIRRVQTAQGMVRNAATREKHCYFIRGGCRQRVSAR